MKRTNWMVTAATLLGVLLAGCGGSTAASTPAPSAPPATAAAKSASGAPSAAASGATSASAAASVSAVAKPASGQPLTIGVTFPLTGPLANWGQLIIPAIQIGADDVNSHGGVNGRPITLDIKDSQGTPAGGVNAMREVVEKDQTPIVLSIFTNVVSAQVPLANQFKVPVVSSVEAAGFAKVSPYTFTMQPLHEEADKLLSQIWKAKGFKKVFAFYPNDPIAKYEEGLLGGVWGAKGPNTWDDALFELGAGDFRGLVEKARQFQPDAILIAGHGTLDEPQIMKQLRQNGVNAALYVNTGTPTIQSYRQAMLPEAAGTVFTSVKCDKRQAASYIDAYKAKVGHEPDYAALEWIDIVRMSGQALKSGTDGQAAQQGLRATKDLPSICGSKFSMDDTNNVPLAISLYELKADGSIVPYQS